MEEIAPEYDVVVLGTGIVETPPSPTLCDKLEQLTFPQD